MRKFLLMMSLTLTLALTFASLAMPESVQNTNVLDEREKITKADLDNVDLDQMDSNPNTSVDIYPMALAVNEPQQFQIHAPKKPMLPKVTVAVPAKKVSPPVAPLQSESEPTITPPNLLYAGQMIDTLGIKKVFLTHDDQTFVLSEQDTFDQRWQIASIQDHQITIFDLHSQQSFILYI